MENIEQNNISIQICEVCESNAKEVYLCELCERAYCEKCSMPFTATNQIDFNCCKTCGNRRIDLD